MILNRYYLFPGHVAEVCVLVLQSEFRRVTDIWQNSAGKLSFFCAMIAAITLRFLDPFGTGKLVLFQVTYDKVLPIFPFLSFMLTSCIPGLARL